jgi:H/ACA ribonucleoprotein complex subunit 3
MKRIYKCVACFTYTLESKCPKCSAEALEPKPPKFSLEDKYSSYRREVKKEGLKKKGLY